MKNEYPYSYDSNFCQVNLRICTAYKDKQDERGCTKDVKTLEPSEARGRLREGENLGARRGARTDMVGCAKGR